MIIEKTQVSRMNIKKDRIAICPHLGCKYLEKVKPIKMSFLSFRKYPKCPKHRLALVFVDEFIENFFDGVTACLFDESSLPPNNIISKIRGDAPDELESFINLWMYSNPIGRGGQIISPYIDGLSKGYMKLMSRKQKKAIRGEKYYKKYEMLHLGLKKITEEYTNFLRKFYKKSKEVYEQKDLRPLSKNTQLIIEGWLKNHLATLSELNSYFLKDSSLIAYKQLYDKILHAGTCSLIVGKAPSIVIKGVSAFELFSTYHEFFKAGLCKELKKENLKLFFKESQEYLYFNEKNIINTKEAGKLVNMPTFKKEIGNYLKLFLRALNNTQEQNNLIMSKSKEVLEEIISRIRGDEFNIYKNSNPKIITAAIIYAVATSDERLSTITMKRLEEITSESQSAISSYYYRHLKRLVPRAEFHFAKGFKDMRNRISICFFEKLKKNIDIKTSSLVLDLQEKILGDTKTLNTLTKNDIKLLESILHNHRDSFNKYFSDLVDVIKNVIDISRIHNQIGAKLSLKPLADLLYRKGIDLIHTFDTFYLSLKEIYDFLKTNYPIFLPKRFRVNLPDKLSKSKYQIIVGNKIKLYIIRHIHKGLYLIDGNINCPKCYEEGLSINTNETRIQSLEFHHKNRIKEYNYTSRKLYRMFIKNSLNPHFLEDLILQMESEGIEVLCSVHHVLEHSKLYRYFREVINWESMPKKFPKDIFSLPSELIHILIWVIVSNFYKDKGKSLADFHSARYSIVNKLKKKYIIEQVYGNLCPTCLEFRTTDHLVSFDFHHCEGPHFNDNPYLYEEHRGKIMTVSELFGKTYTCSEIVKILEYEKGGYLCKNCHSVIQYSPLELQLLDEIYEDHDSAKNVLMDYTNVKNQFTLLRDISIIENPLSKTVDISENILRYIDAFYEISQHGQDITIRKLMNYLELSVGAVSAFFRRNWSFIIIFIDIKYKDPRSFTSFKNVYVLTEKGKNYIELLHYVRDNFKNLF